MTFMPLRPPVQGSIDQAAQRIYQLLEQEERRKRGPGRHARPAPSAAVSNARRTGEITPRNVLRVAQMFDEFAETTPGGLLGALLKDDRPPARPGDRQVAQAAPQSTDGADPRQTPFMIIPKRQLPIPETMGIENLDDWAPFSKSLGNPANGAPLTESEIAAFRTTFGLEGGTEPEPGTGVRAGLTKKWLGDYVKIKGLPKELTESDKLTIDDMARSYKAYADKHLENAGGGDALAEIGDAKTATQIFDVIFKHGRSDGALVIIDALNSVIGSMAPRQRERLGLSPIEIMDRKSEFAFGDQSLDRVRKLVDAGYAKRLRAAIIDQRHAMQPVSEGLGGLDDRYEYHR